MKITFCAYDAPNNIDGPTAWMKRLLPYLRMNGVEIRIIYFAANHKDLSAYNYFNHLGFQCKIIYWELFYEEKVMAILEDIKNYPPDIFIPNYFPFAFSAAKWIKRCGIPTIMILHNDNNFHHALVEEYAAQNNDDDVSAIVGVSKLITETIYNQTTRHDNIYCIPYGAPVPQKIAVNPAGKELNLVYAGRIVEPQKRISEVTRAFCKVAKEIPGTSCTIYGSGRSEPEMKKILNTEGKGLPVKYGGKLESGLVQQYLLQNHVFVLLSDYEGIPISLMEAMGCGLVPVCSNIRSGMTELIENGKNGILVNDRNDAFVQAIKMLKDDPIKWQSLSIAAREKIITEYSEDVCNRNWLDLLKQLLENAGQKKILQIPSMKELKKQIAVRKEFKEYSMRTPFVLLIPLYKTKFLLGRIKRRIFKQVY
jgi:colanic acid/amylovoran biosynthesis glycosyltransferase